MIKTSATLKSFLALFLILGCVSIGFSQEEESVTRESSSSSSRSDDDKKAKRHNQMEFLEEQKDKEDFSLEDRMKISKPMMPSYTNDTADYYKGKKKREQQRAYKDREYYYPAKPKNQWEVAAHLGSFLIDGDVKKIGAPWKSFGFGVSARRSFGYVFSMRAQYLFGMAQGKDWRPKDNLSNNPAMRNDEINYFNNVSLQPANTETGDNAEGIWFHNFKTVGHDISIQGMLTFGNINFHKERTLLNFTGYFGIGAFIYNTKMDALDADGNLYDLSPAIRTYYETLEPDASVGRGDVFDALDEIRDGSFESEAESQSDFLGEYAIAPSYTAGMNVGYHLTKRFTLSLDYRLTFMIDDLLDGDQWQISEKTGSRVSRGVTRDYDNFHFISFGFHVHLGKDAIEPLYWMNPMDFAYKKMGEMDPEKMIDDLLKDDDKDGVPNRLDQEPETVEGAPVDPKGMALDSDKDGMIDLLDLEPFSPPGYPIDENGIAQLPEDETGPEMIQQALNCDQLELPSIHYDLDKFYIKPEYYAHLHQIAEKMQLCPDVRVVAVGHTDVRFGDKYNMQLSWNRVNEAINYLVEKYALDKSRFLVSFEGEELAEKATNEYGHYLNRRVEFKVASSTDSGESEPEQPFPSLNAGSNKR